MRFVVLVLFGFACRTPPEQSPQPRAADAGVDVSYDAAVEPDASTVVYGPCDWSAIEPKNPQCALEHMPLMHCRDVNGPNNRFPKCIPDKVEDAKPIVLQIKRRDGARIIVDGGTNRGITKQWRAEVIAAKELPLRGGQATLIRVDADEIELLTKLHPEVVSLHAKGVRFSPPKP